MTKELFALETGLCVDVAVPLPITGLFTYSVPADLAPKAKPGARVRVTFKNREIMGYIVASSIVELHPRTKPVLDILDTEPVLPNSILELTKWMGEYYGSSWGEAIENALPKWVKYGKKAEKAIAKAAQNHEELPSQSLKTKDFELSKDQIKAFKEISHQLEQKKPTPILLYGVTGSGKSELYIRAMREVLKRGRSAICLVPEIALTEQLRRFFREHFGDELEILHSKLSDSERFLAWKRLETGTRQVVLGPRSAVFAPISNLGMIIMDEEHEGSYKQETTPRYHAREVALWRTANEGALFVMGTATPSLEAMYRSDQGEFIRIELKTRIAEREMPKVQILDLKNVQGDVRKKSMITPKLLSEIQVNLMKKEGTLLLLNRRGFSTHIHCPRCGHVENCVSCQVSLTFHQEDETLLCHYCNLNREVPSICSNCKSPLLRFSGFGTEKVESEVANHFPQARISRMDADTVRKKGSHEVILKEFRDRKIDILIGTQMIAKGFDFPHVTLVGVILADVGLMLPDFRSAERTFQLMTQVAGRAGRGSLPGRVYIQTYSPDHPSIRFAKEHDYKSFYDHELPQRRAYHYPPAGHLTNIIVRAREEKNAYAFSLAVRNSLRDKLQIQPLVNEETKVELMGPAPLPFYKLRGNFRWHVMIKNRSKEILTPKILECLQSVKKTSGVAYALDVDPLNIL